MGPLRCLAGACNARNVQGRPDENKKIREKSVRDFFVKFVKMNPANVWSTLKRFDAYAKPMDDFRIRTRSGGILTVLSGIAMVILFASEIRDYLQPELKEELFVDTSRTGKLKINVDVIFSRISCDFLSIDAMDVSGEQHIDIEHNIFKRRLDLDGKPIEDPQKEHNLGAVAKISNETSKASGENKTVCGSCYGAETSERNCCNTCNDVREAYRIKTWKFDPRGIEQCRDGLTSEVEERALKEGCQIYGYLEVNRVGGSFHIAPGKSFVINHIHVHDVNPFASTDFNVTHRIRHLSFGQQIENGQSHSPLDGVESTADKGAMMFQYYLKIVPTTYTQPDGSFFPSNQFSVTRHSKVVSVMAGEGGMPGVFFSYEMSPVMVKYSLKEKSLGHFLTGLCAIIGGVFTVAGLLDKLIYTSSRLIEQKIELGKAT